jgi:diguanylate cyclase (GGDEF)-like protein
LQSQQTQRGDLVTLSGDAQPPVRYAVSATPIIGSDGNSRGALVSFHDVTALELKKEQMARMLQELSASRDEVQRKNRDLQVLASTDSLTGCLNRRSFSDRFSSIWERDSQNLSAIMVDIDHFKKVNDCYGHSTGDVVLQETGRMLLELVANRGVVGRYGGEEFAVVMEGMPLHAAKEFAEAIRLEFIRRRPGGLDATMSVGVTSSEMGATDCNQLLEQADQCLYSAKREGRNRVVAWDGSREFTSFVDEQTIALRNSNQFGPHDKSSVIQYPVITAILSALAFRDRDTAAHSTRVARLCLQVGGRLLNKDELYELEIAALLHDVGKIGVPDSILKKPGALTADEWRIMRWHDDIGIEIVRAAFASDKVTEFIRCHYQQQEKSNHDREMDFETIIPLGSRVLTVCDAFDSMTTDSVYRKAMPVDAALAELYNAKNSQFDPLVVRTLERALNDQKALTGQALVAISSPLMPTPLEMGAYVEHLSEAIATGNVEKLRAIAQRVEATAMQHNIDSVVQAANRLEMSIDHNEASLNQLMGLADEIIDLCRSARTQIIENPVVIRSEELISSEIAAFANKQQ